MVMQNDKVVNVISLKEKAKDLTLLYVEDEKDLHVRTTDFLCKLFSKVDTAIDGKEATF